MKALLYALPLLVSPAATLACDLKAVDAQKAGPECARAWMDANLKLTDLNAVGTHNSYKLPIAPDVLATLRKVDAARVRGLEYGHRPLAEQLDGGARQLEIDVFHDPEGGRFAKPALGAVMPEHVAALAQPGFKVLHMQDVDHRTHCATFVACLTEVRDWSARHRDHAPILILINAKSGRSVVPNGVAALDFDEKAFDALDEEIRSVFDEDQLITPDQVQGRHPSLRDAVLAGSWPSLGDSRGKVLFALDEAPEKVALYRGQRRALEGRAMFVNTDEASPAAAYLTLNDPIGQQERIRAAVAAGFLVRTRADAETLAARTGDTRQRSAAFASGAQYISTDYMDPDPAFPHGYTVRLPKGEVARCNPQRRQAAGCAGLPIEP